MTPISEEAVLIRNTALLLSYSEWLDADQALVRGPVEGADDRTHEQLVAEFLAGRK